jgi:outer membrane receptor protein involved in Fe transport
MQVPNTTYQSRSVYRGSKITSGFAVAIMLLALSATNAIAQSRTAAIVGTVTDPSGGLVSGAKVTVSNILTRESKTAITSDLGEYTVLDLLYGQYEVTIEKEGFKRLSRPSLVLEIGQQRKVDATLVVGATAEVVEVKGEAPLLTTQTATVSQVIASKEVKDLPLNGRNWLDLAALAAGAVTPRTGNGPSFNIGSSISVNGANADMNSFTIDGIENNAPLASNQAVNPTIDSIQEFSIESSISPAEYGRAAAQISVATKSGTNQWHGGLYEFFRNDILDAKNYFEPGDKLPLRQNNFGGTFGGPIKKNKSFFFFSYDATRTRTSFPGFAIIPPAAFMQGDFSSVPDQLTDGFGNPLPGNQVPASSIHPTAAALLALYPQPNLSDPVFNYFNPIGDKVNSNQWSLRVDHAFNDKDRIFVRANVRNSTDATNGIFPIGIGGQEVKTPGRSIGASYTHMFSPNTLNTLRAGYSYFDLRIVAEGFKHDFGAAVRPPSVEDPNFAFLGFSLVGYDGIGFGNIWLKEPDNTYNLVDTLSWIHGKHILKTGVDIRRWQNNLAESFAYTMNFDGSYTGNAVADMLFGYGASASAFGGNLRSNLRRWDHAAFIQDDWRITETLTLNLGLRWDYIGALSDANDNLENFDFATGTLTFPGTAGYPTRNRNRTFRDLNNFAPRIGLAWNPKRLPNTVVRMGYGLFYVPSEGQLDLILGPKDDPFLNFFGDVSDPTALSLDNPAPAGGSAGGFPLVSATDVHLRTPYAQQWHLTLQHQLKGNIVVQTGYTGNIGTKLAVINPFNVPQPGPGPIQDRRPYPAFGYSEINEQSGRSAYHGWQTKIEKRYSHGLSLLGSYSWTKAIDNNSFLGFRQFNPFDINQDRGLADHDARHRFTAGWTYELPFGRGRAFLKSSGITNYLIGGWSVGGIVLAESGMPFTVRLADADAANWGIENRPDVVGDPVLSNPTIQQWFNISAFEAPADFSIGNAGRNIVIGPALHNWDMIFAKQIHIREGHELQFRGEFFNAFNHPQFNRPGRTLGVGSFGVISSARPGRVMQLALKYNF